MLKEVQQLVPSFILDDKGVINIADQSWKDQAAINSACLIIFTTILRQLVT